MQYSILYTVYKTYMSLLSCILRRNFLSLNSALKRTISARRLFCCEIFIWVWKSRYGIMTFQAGWESNGPLIPVSLILPSFLAFLVTIFLNVATDWIIFYTSVVDNEFVINMTLSTSNDCRQVGHVTSIGVGYPLNSIANDSLVMSHS